MVFNNDAIFNAMKKGEIIAYFQPQYDASTGIMSGAEILTRWIKDNKIISPDSFIPVLEESDAIIEFDWYMTELACKALIQIKDLNLPISVNFSRWHATEKDFINRMNSILEKYSIPKELIHVEITETALYLSENDVCTWVKNIHEAGFKVSLDDFGSGLSSIGILTELPIDIIKFDKSLFKVIDNQKTRVILDALFYGANRLGVETIAEGIETNEQLKFIQTCNCSKVQGYYFDPPMPQEDFLTLANGFLNKIDNTTDVLSYSSVGHLLLQAIYQQYPMIILGNLSKNCYYMVSHEDFTITNCAAAGTFDDLIEMGTASMKETDKENFYSTFSRESLLKAYSSGKKEIRLIAEQKGDDGIYRKVETIDYFVNNPSRKDILVISFNRNI